MGNAGRETLTVNEAAEALGICRNGLYRLVRQGVIPHLRLGRRLLVPRAAFEEMLRQPGKFSRRTR